ncbi:hypothetical protein THALO_190057 [Tenacibaculum halocynthiae]
MTYYLLESGIDRHQNNQLEN